MIRRIFLYWDQGVADAPEVVRRCLASWRHHNPGWQIVELDAETLADWVDIGAHIPGIADKDITRTALSDIIRILLLAEHGGLWVDATALCVQPLDGWLPDCADSGFFAFAGDPDRPPLRLLASWFLYSTPGHPLTLAWRDRVVAYWRDRDAMHTYFWFHLLHADLCREDATARAAWQAVPRVSIGQTFFGTEPLDAAARALIDGGREKVFKLTYKHGPGQDGDGSILSYILKTAAPPA